MEIWNKRVFELMDYAIKYKLVDGKMDFFKTIGAPPSVGSEVMKGTRSFTIAQIRNVCLLTGANFNWVVDIEKEKFRTKGKNKTALQLMREAYAAAESELTKKKPPVRPEILN